MAPDLYEWFCKTIDQQYRDYAMDIARGGLSHEEYKRMSGVAQGLIIAKTMLVERVEELGEFDDD